MLIFPLTVKTEESLTCKEAKQAVKQSIQAWYMRGNNRQYNSAKAVVNDVIEEAFGFKAGSGNKIGGLAPVGSTAYSDEAETYLLEHNCFKNPKASGCDGNYAIYYKSNDNGNNYIYKPDDKNYLKWILT